MATTAERAAGLEVAYLCGPISLNGTCSPEEKTAFKAVFALHAERLRAAGLEIVSPVEFAHCESWEECMKLGLTAVCHSDAVAVLPRWLESRGAMLEVFVARQLGVPVLPVDELPRSTALDLGRT